jgi:hypothetical protein
MRIPCVPVPSKSGFEMPLAFREVWKGFRSAAHCTGVAVGLRASPEGIIASPGLVRRPVMGIGAKAVLQPWVVAHACPAPRAASGANSFWLIQNLGLNPA